ncbi:MAG: LysR family transcriptional regulator [Rhizobiales bacterium]|nr:LysR family transcriptional regulator [Hyphomicrobiales bacterium]
MFTLIQLETFYWVARLGGFSAAARHLNATQPAISARIRQLEHLLGARVFERDSRGIALTPSGESLFLEAEELIRHVGRIRYDLSDPRLIAGRIRIGVAELVAVTWLNALVSRLNETYPKVRIELDVDLTLSLSEKLAAGGLDVAILPGPIADSSLELHSVGSAPFAWMASPSLGVPAGPITPKDLAAWPIITLSNRSNLHKLLEEWFARGSAQLRRIDVCNSLSVVTQMVLAGLGISYLSVLQTREMVGSGRLHIVETTPTIAALEYFVAFPRRSTAPLAAAVARLAVEVSNFDPAPTLEIPSPPTRARSRKASGRPITRSRGAKRRQHG